MRWLPLRGFRRLRLFVSPRQLSQHSRSANLMAQGFVQELLRSNRIGTGTRCAPDDEQTHR
ncbi:MAG: hypothetical protein AVDCRST_MAG42-961 [uncultured Chthoniobacterales bacterium]|uniref:Uncharacterized protein n=1 Tax=uncultured Chthoniobacterales bacterium TaxID=1836801 RepID=A0A6J4HLT5_9BACT|nr:MAG: hypothetical protein AVDCRST_MAG42-961 [uncultured Chthoniobacterales bacterium]